MQVKVFEGLTLKDAIKSVKREFGSDAVILSTREKKLEGASRDARVIEVTAAAPGSNTSRSDRQDSESNSDNSALLESRLAGIESRLQSLQNDHATRRHIQSIESGLVEMRQALFDLVRTKDSGFLKNLPSDAEPVVSQLRAMGVNDALLSQLAKHLRGLDKDSAKSLGPVTSTTLKQPSVNQLNERDQNFYRDQSILWLMKKIQISPGWNINQGSQTIQAFVGASGVGKTSLVAKLAARYSANQKISTAVISYDTDKIAGSEQLRVISKLINVPFFVANSPNELQRKILDMQQYDLILIDTSGRNPRSDVACNDLMSIRTESTPVEFGLVLQTSDQQLHLERTISYFSQLGISSVNFTKLDEAWNFGELLNVSWKWSIPMGFLSLGAKIPEDLERATRERVIERLFGL